MSLLDSLKKDLLRALKLLAIMKRMPTNQEKLYSTAKFNLGWRLTLDPSVPPDLGCAEAVSTILVKAGVRNIPDKGIQGTAQLYTFLHTNLQFLQVDTYERGNIIISPSGSPGSLLEHGHVGICGDFGIMSNNSYTGLFDEALNLERWQDFFITRGHFPIFYFKWL